MSCQCALFLLPRLSMHLLDFAAAFAGSESESQIFLDGNLGWKSAKDGASFGGCGRGRGRGCGWWHPCSMHVNRICEQGHGSWRRGLEEGSLHNTYRRHLVAHLEEIFRSRRFVLPTHFTFYCISNAFLATTPSLSLSFEFR